jgi:hypothetical protein
MHCNIYSSLFLRFFFNFNFPSSAQTKDALRKEKMKRLNETRIKEISSKISAVVFENIELKSIFDSVLATRKPNDSRSASPHQLRNAKAKLSFKLARVILLLRNLVNACNKKYINESVQFRLLANTMLRQNIFNRADDDVSRSLLKSSSIDELDEDDERDDDMEDEDSDDEFRIEFEILGLTSDEKADESALRVYSHREDGDNEDDYEDDEDEDDDLDDNYSIILNGLLSNGKLIDNEYSSILSNYAAKLNGKQQESLVDYKEDMVSSIERDVEEVVKDLRADYPDIDRYVQDIYLTMAKEWLGKYEDELLKGKYRQRKDRDENGKKEKEK